jgi:hypothetical protein
MSLDLESRVSGIQGGRALLGSFVASVGRADELLIAAVEHRPATRLDLLGDESLTAERHTSHLCLPFAD